jgi:Zn-dependent protease with chaperone function
MFKCPVCHSATFNFWQYGIKSSLSTVECSNCHTVLHQARSRLRRQLAVSPLLLTFIPSLLGWSWSSRFLLALWIGLIFSLIMWIAVQTTKLEPIAPPDSRSSTS